MAGLAALTAAPLACGDNSRGATSQQTAVNTVADTNAPPPPPQLASNEGQIIIGDHALIRQGAVGPLRVGEWRRPVMSFVYVVKAEEGRDSSAVFLVRGIGKDTVSLTFTNDTLRTIFVTRPGAHTADGIGVGTPFATVAGRADATVEARGSAQVASITGLCGVRFATDSAALGSDSVVKKTAAGPATVRAIAVGNCTRRPK